MLTRNNVLTDHHHAVIVSPVGSSRRQNASEVLRDGLLPIEQREAEKAARLEALRRATAVGWRDLEAGRYRDVGEEALAEYVGELGVRASGQVRARG